MPPIFIGTILSMLGIAFGIGTGVIVKIIADDVNIVMTLWYRFLFSLPILFLVAYWTKGRRFYVIHAKKTLFLRVIFGMGGILFWFLSVRSLPLGLATSVMHSSVIYIAMLSPLILSERVGIYRWSAVIFGLAGVFIISDAFTNQFDAAILFAICASVSGAGLQLALRRLGKSDAPASVASWYNFAGFLVMSVVVMIVPSFWQSFDAQIMWYLILLGVFGSFLQICFTSSYLYIDAVVVATTRYLQVPLAALLGFFAFGEVPTTAHYIGAFLIVSSSFVIVIREFQKRGQ